jgi:hypothetical protein
VAVPEPSGGLVPYRKGTRWGYSDTLGNLVIQPVFAREPGAFLLGFGVLTPERDSLTLINARGEMIRATRSRALGLLPDGSLQLLSRRGRGFRPALSGLRYLKGSRTAVRDTLWLAPNGEDDLTRLSPTRVVRYLPSLLPGKLATLNPEYERGALLDAQGKALTGYDYADITPFIDGFARAERFRSGQVVLLNRQGQEVLPLVQRGSTVSGLSNVYHNRALVQRHYGADTAAASYVVELVDSTGRVLRALAGHSYGSWLINGQVYCAKAIRGPLHLFDRDGQPLLNGAAFTEVDQFYNNRLRARTQDGFCGLLDRRLRWVAAPRYQDLYHLSNNGNRMYSLNGVSSPRYDTAYVVIRQHDQYGLLRCRDGQVVVPIRYDTVTRPLTRGFATLVRAKRSYVVNARGQELSEGVVDWGSLPDRQDGPSWVSVRRGQEVAVFDENGQRCPWQPFQVRCRMPQYGHRGLVIVYDCSRKGSLPVASLLNQAGQRQLLPQRYERIQAIPGFYAMQLAESQSPRTNLPWDLYDEALRPLLTEVNGWNQLPGNWVGTTYYLLHPSGRRIRVPEATGQSFANEVAYLPQEPFARGVWRLTWLLRISNTGRPAGYITRGGRRLWED